MLNKSARFEIHHSLSVLNLFVPVFSIFRQASHYNYNRLGVDLFPRFAIPSAPQHQTHDPQDQIEIEQTDSK